MDETSGPSGGAWDSSGTEQFTWRDLPRSLGLAFDLGKWWTALLWVVVGALLGILLVKKVPDWMGWSDGHPVLVTLCYILAGVIGYFAASFATSGVAYQVRGEVIDNTERSFEDVWAFWARNLSTLIWVPLGMILLAAIPMLAVVFCALVGRYIPYLGPFLWAGSLIMTIPLGLFSVVTLFVLALGSFVYPAIVAVKEEEAFDVVHDLFDLVKNRGGQLLLGILITSLLLVATIGILWLGTSATLGVGFWIMDGQALALPNQTWDAFQVYFRWLTSVWEPLMVEVEPGMTASGLLFGFLLFLVTVGGVSYFVSLWAAGGTMTYLVIADPMDIEDVIQRARSDSRSDLPRPEPAWSPEREPSASDEWRDPTTPAADAAPAMAERTTPVSAASAEPSPASAEPETGLSAEAGTRGRSRRAKSASTRSGRATGKKKSTRKSKSTVSSKKKTARKSGRKSARKSAKKTKQTPSDSPGAAGPQ